MLKQIQNEFNGEAKRLNLKNEEDVLDLVKQVRKEMWEEKNTDND